MNTAIILVSNEKELAFAKTKVLGKRILDYLVNELKRLDISTLFLLGLNDIQSDELIKRSDINDILADIADTEGKCILTKVTSPLLTKEDYQLLLEQDKAAAFVDKDSELIPVFAIANKDLANYEELDYVGVPLEYNQVSFEDIGTIQKEFRKRINEKLLNKGVSFIDIDNTYIGPDVIVDKETVIYPNVLIEGKCLIGKNNVIKGSCHLNNVVIGDNNVIDNCCNLDKCILGDKVKIGPNVLINNCDLAGSIEIGAGTNLIDCRISNNVQVNALSYLKECELKEGVQVGCSVIVVNNGLISIKENALVGSNVTLIAPLTISQSAVVAAGSTIEESVAAGDLAIARLYQQNKKGYGYKYFNKEK